MKTRMMNIIKTLFIAFIFSSFCFYTAYASDLNVYIDGEEVQFTEYTGSPYIDSNSRTLVPLRVTMENYGCAVSWDSENKTALVSKNGVQVQVPVGKKVVSINGTSVATDTQAVILNGRTYLPIRVVLEAFGASLTWEPTSKSVLVAREGYVYDLNEFLSKNIRYEWNYPYPDGGEWYFEATYLIKYYNMYRDVDRSTIYGYDEYVSDPSDDEYLNWLVNLFQTSADKEGYDEWQTLELIISFVQSLDYVLDSDWSGYDEYAKFPYETLYDGCGDCEDTSILLISLLRELGYGCCLIYFPGEHTAVGILGNDSLDGIYFESNGKKYFYIETTAAGWAIGEMPEEFQTKKAQLIFP